MKQNNIQSRSSSRSSQHSTKCRKPVRKKAGASLKARPHGTILNIGPSFQSSPKTGSPWKQTDALSGD